MSISISRRGFFAGAGAGALVAVTSGAASACSRVFWNDNKVKVIGRTFDWEQSMGDALWTMPAGLERNGGIPDNPARWTSKYSSVVMGIADKGTSEGINDQGLAANMLYLEDAQFEPRDAQRPGIGFWLWAQYILDNYKSVREAIADPKLPQIVRTDFGPYKGGMPVHLALADINDDSAIVEFVEGQAVIHDSRRYQVMTNEPTYDEQIANVLRYKAFGGTIAELPGGIQPKERFVRAAYSLKYLPKTDDQAKSIAYVMSIMNNVSVPFGSPYVGVSGTFPTWWRSVIDLTNKVYAVQTTVTPNTFWVDIAKLNNNAAGAKTRTLPIYNESLVGEVSDKFEEKPQPF